jgi:hypothetical protein
MARTQTDHPLFTAARQQIEMHHPRGAGHRGLTAELRSGRRCETEGLAPGHELEDRGNSSLQQVWPPIPGAPEIRTPGWALRLGSWWLERHWRAHR